MSTKSYVSEASESTSINRPSLRSSANGGEVFRNWPLAQKLHLTSATKSYLLERDLSPWTRSRSKRIFDCVCVLSMMPLLIPVLLTVALAVRLTSRGPVLFMQKRMGRNGRSFTIVKFRTMLHAAEGVHRPVTTSGNQLFTPVGPFLRRSKLDELPQLFNVLAGQMSLVGPRPKLPEHEISNLPCRAGITGAATLAFAREEAVLAGVPTHRLEAFYHSVILPAKCRLDADYMRHATFFSDLNLIFDSVFRRWNGSIMEDLLKTWTFEQGHRLIAAGKTDSERPLQHATMPHKVDRPTAGSEARAY